METRAPGTGLSWLTLSIALFASVLLFVFWNGAIWSSPTGASHISRIVISYLVIVPMLVFALFVAKRFSVARLVTGTALLWGIKLVVTSTLYFALAPGATRQYAPDIAWTKETQTRTSSAPRKYRSSASTLAHAKISGKASPRAIAFIEDPPAGRPLDPSRRVEITIRDADYEHALYAASIADELYIANQDSALHTLTLKRSGVTRANLPVPPKSELHRVALASGAGIYELTCENHDSERALLAIFDHPYFAMASADGEVAIDGVPLGAMTLGVLATDGTVEKQTITVGADGLAALVLTSSEDDR